MNSRSVAELFNLDFHLSESISADVHLMVYIPVGIDETIMELYLVCFLYIAIQRVV